MKENSILRYLLILVITLMLIGITGIKIMELRLETLENKIYEQNIVEEERWTIFYLII